MIDKKQAKALGVTTIDRTQVLQEAQAEKIRAIKKLLPNTIADNQLNIEALQEILSKHSTTSNNKGYELSFAGKGLARAQADTATTKELKIEKAQSKNFDTTGNVVIRGDNLDVLKILYKNYHKKIKMIYIDPPYNTQSEAFIYNDNFKKNEEALREELGLAEDTINFLHNVYGTRSHSGWLSFMYPRLKIARELLRDDGVIFISIDDNEQANLKIICDEIFGEENFVIDIIRKTKSTTNDAKEGINIQHENCLVYAKNKHNIILFGGQKDLSRYSNPDNDPNGDWTSDNPSAKSGNAQHYFEIKNPYTGKVDVPPTGRYWIFSQNTIQKYIDNGTICFKKKHKSNERGFIYKRYKNKLKSNEKVLNSLFSIDNAYMNQKATKNLLDLGLGEYFKYPKGYEYIQILIQHATPPSENAFILDFFAGSGTTGDAVMQLNAEDGGKRKYILVQLDEKIDEKKNKEAYNFCKENKFPPVISSICIERLNRAGEKLKQEENNADKNIDIGYKVFSLVEKPNIDMQEDKLQLVHERQGTANTLYNMLVATCKPLDSPIETIIKDTLYICDNEVYLLATVDRDTLIKYKDHKVNIDAYASIDLQAYFNMQVSTSENINIVY